MHRTQIYFEEELFDKIKRKASMLGLSISAYIREVIKKDIEKEKKVQQINLSEISGIWKDRDISLKEIREKAWK